MKQFYTYVHCRPDGTPFYVGKGHGSRSHHFGVRNPHHKNIVAKHGKENIVILVFPAESEEQSFVDEIKMIESFRQDGFSLVNMTGGGEGVSNPSQEVRTKIGAAKKGNKYWVGRKHSDATKKKIAANGAGNTNKRGKKLSPESCKRISAAKIGTPSSKKGIPLTEDTKRKLSERALGRTLSGETKTKISNALKSRTKTTAHCKNLSIARKEWWARRKQQPLPVAAPLGQQSQTVPAGSPG